MKLKYSDKDRIIFLKRWLLPKLRRISRFWPAGNEVLKTCKVVVETGEFFKNGKPKTKVMWKCQICNELYDKLERDHIKPVHSLKDDENDWNNLLDRIFSPTTNYQCICGECHKSKTKKESKKRLAKRKKKK